MKENPLVMYYFVNISKMKKRRLYNKFDIKMELISRIIGEDDFNIYCGSKVISANLALLIFNSKYFNCESDNPKFEPEAFEMWTKFVNFTKTGIINIDESEIIDYYRKAVEYKFTYLVQAIFKLISDQTVAFNLFSEAAEENKKLVIQDVVPSINNYLESDIDWRNKNNYNALVDILEASKICDVDQERLIDFIINNAPILKGDVLKLYDYVFPTQHLDSKKIETLYEILYKDLEKTPIDTRHAFIYTKENSKLFNEIRDKVSNENKEKNKMIEKTITAMKKEINGVGKEWTGIAKNPNIKIDKGVKFENVNGNIKAKASKNLDAFFVFVVGAPGVGKTFCAAKLVSGFLPAECQLGADFRGVIPAKPAVVRKGATVAPAVPVVEIFDIPNRAGDFVPAPRAALERAESDGLMHAINLDAFKDFGAAEGDGGEEGGTIEETNGKDNEKESGSKDSERELPHDPANCDKESDRGKEDKEDIKDDENKESDPGKEDKEDNEDEKDEIDNVDKEKDPETENKEDKESELETEDKIDIKDEIDKEVNTGKGQEENESEKEPLDVTEEDEDEDEANKDEKAKQSGRNRIDAFALRAHALMMVCSTAVPGSVGYLAREYRRVCELKHSAVPAVVLINDADEKMLPATQREVEEVLSPLGLPSAVVNPARPVDDLRVAFERLFAKEERGRECSIA